MTAKFLQVNVNSHNVYNLDSPVALLVVHGWVEESGGADSGAVSGKSVAASGMHRGGMERKKARKMLGKSLFSQCFRALQSGEDRIRTCGPV
ncbi:MAG: hypothetical protein KDB03_23735 [Planctomycetales bacterium]|nr:hypothetical protein [Planctomycetales bacterium]